MAIQVEALFRSLTTRVDKTLKLVFETNEMSSQKNAELMEYVHKYGFLFFGNEGEEVVVPKEPVKEFTSDKTPSQRLRAVLFVYWQQIGTGEEDFEVFYRRQMERFINHFKEKLDQ